MAKMLHLKLVGKLEVSEKDGVFTITVGGDNVIDALLTLEDVGEVILDAVAYSTEQPETPSSGPYPVPDNDWLNKMMGNDGRQD